MSSFSNNPKDYLPGPVELPRRKGKVKKAWKPDPYLFAAFRRVFRWSPERRAALERVKTISEGLEKFKCERCANLFSRKEVAVDHASPVVDPRHGFSGWDEYALRLFCPREGLQILCLTDHKDKTRRENEARRKFRPKKRKAA